MSNNVVVIVYDRMSWKLPLEVTKDEAYCFRRMNHINMPCLVGASVDIDSDCEYVNAAVALPGGTDMATVEVCLSPDGKKAKLSYDWPHELFSEEITANQRVDSKILSMTESLRRHQTRTDIAPRASIVIPLPLSAQTDSKTWVKSVGGHHGEGS